MGEQMRGRISAADCIAYADSCELWAERAPDQAAQQRLLDMARSWRELHRHFKGSAAAAKRKKSRVGKASPKTRPSATAAPSRRSH